MNITESSISTIYELHCLKLILGKTDFKLYQIVATTVCSERRLEIGMADRVQYLLLGELYLKKC